MFGSISTAEIDTGALVTHLAAHYGIDAIDLHRLDSGVMRVERNDGPDWVARVFPPDQSIEAVAGDAATLAWLAEHDYPAERAATDVPVSMLGSSPVLVTEFVHPVPRELRRPTVKEAGGLRELGSMLGMLHALPLDAGAPAQAGGAWHHAARGLPTAELDAAREWVGAALESPSAADRATLESPSAPDRATLESPSAPDRATLESPSAPDRATLESPSAPDRATPESPSAPDRASLAVVLAELDHADSGDGLPQAFTHPDFVLANVVATAAPRMVVVDWTGAGRGPRLWSLAFLLWVEGGKDLRRIDLIAAGYRRRVELEPDEVDRIAGMVRARHLVFVAWNLAAGRIGPTEAAELVRESRVRGEAIAERSRWAFTAARR